MRLGLSHGLTRELNARVAAGSEAASSDCLRSYKATPVISSIKARAKRPVPTRTPPAE